MNSLLTNLAPGCYQYTYPTFVDVAQYISIHFLTPDGQQAFVSYPYHPNYKAARLVPLSWFKSVCLHRLAGQPVILVVIETFLTGWFTDGKQSPGPATWHSSPSSPLAGRTAVS